MDSSKNLGKFEELTENPIYS